ncbi:MAG TPA: RHS repeat-associated core domain-containing protein [Thermoanaerobaculia bacterium]|nr:RHS repeat-associated core domain-containing protein [Thermoanaerobaculia bacterium]
MFRLLRAAVLCTATVRLLNAAEPVAYIVPVVTAKVNDRIYSTTVALRNDSAHDVGCEAIYAVPNDPKGGTLRSRYTVPRGGRPHVEEDVLMEVGAVGTMRIVCSGQLAVAARVQASVDGGHTFDQGRTFAGLNEAASFKRLRTLTTRSDLLAAEVAGKAVSFEAIVKNDAGAIIGRKTYEVPAFAQQIVNLSTLRDETHALHVEIHVRSGSGALVVGEETRDPALLAMAVRMTPEARRAFHEHNARQVAAASATATAGPSITEQLLLSPFKAAPFRDPATGLVLMRDRWYDPSTGTFLSPDPEGYADSSNLYIFGKGDPVNNSDPTGRLVKFSGKDPWGDFFLFRDSLHNPAAAALLTLQGGAKRGYVLGLRPGVTKAQFLATAIPDPTTYMSDLAAQGIPLPNDRRTVEEKVFAMMSSMHITEFRTDTAVTQRSSAPFSWWPLNTRWGTFERPVTAWGGGVTLEPDETLSGNTEVVVDPSALLRGSAWGAEVAYNLTYDPLITTIHEFGHALAYHSNHVPCFQMWSVYFENQVRARRGERMFRFSESPLAKKPNLLRCPSQELNATGN